MMKLAIACTLLSLSLSAQDQQNIMAPVHAVFEGMKRGDSAMVHKAFYKDAFLHTVVKDQKSGQPALRTEKLASFLKSVGTPHQQVYLELIWGEKIQVDGDFAQVWVDYAFYLGSTFSHCGVDAFHLIRNGQGEWQIYSLSDTRRKEGCNVPKEVSDKAAGNK